LQAYTVEQVAKMLNVGRDKIYHLLRTGQLRSIKIGKLRRITEERSPSSSRPSKRTLHRQGRLGTS
jgi:excisionase family DNA binding protein